jgi:hypothetical protein
MKILVKSLIASALSSAIALSPVVSQADTLEEIKQVLENIYSRQENNELYRQKQNYKTSPDAGATVAGNASQVSQQNKVKQAVTEKTIAIIKNALDNTQTNRKTKQDMSNLPAADTPNEMLTASTSLFERIRGGSNERQQQKTRGNFRFNLNTLLGSNYYQYGDKMITLDELDLDTPTYQSLADYAMQFILFVSGEANPEASMNYEDIAKSASKTVEEIYNIDEVRDYRLKLRKYIAAKATGLNNLLDMYYQRVPIASLGLEAGIPQAKNKIHPNASLAQVEEYNATRRLDPSWYEEMAKAPPATIQREFLFLMAEMRHEQYLQRKQNEQLLATLSVMLMQQADQASSLEPLSRTKEKAIEAAQAKE